MIFRYIKRYETRKRMKQLSLFILLHTLLFAQIQLPKSFSADFTQMITNSKKKVIHYSGKVYFSDSKDFKWSYLEPTKKEVCTDGVELLVVDHDLEQVSAYYITKGLDIVKVLKKATPHSKNIYVADYDGKKYTIQLDESQELHSIAYYDDLDNKVQILFKEMNYTDKNLPTEVMQCNYPIDYDVIRG